MADEQSPTGQRAGVRFLPAGDTALSVEFGDRIDRTLNDRVLRLRDRMREADIEGVIETVPTFRSLMVHYDPNRVGGAQLTDLIGNLLDEDATKRKVRRVWRVPTCYAEDCAPDL